MDLEKIRDQEEIKNLLWNCYVPVLVYIHKGMKDTDSIKITKEGLEPYISKIICLPEQMQCSVVLDSFLQRDIPIYKDNLNKLRINNPIDYSCENCNYYKEINEKFDFIYLPDGERSYQCNAGTYRTKAESKDKGKNCNYFIPKR